MSKRDRPAEYRVPSATRLRRRLLWRLKRMRGAVDVETLGVFDHELAAFERAGVADLEAQRTRNVAACSRAYADAQARRELIRREIERTEGEIRRADQAAARLDAKLGERDPEFHDYA